MEAKKRDMKSIAVHAAVAVLALGAAGLLVHAQTASAPSAATAAAGDMAEGEVRKIDKENAKITLRHGPIKQLDMPGMTMVFQVPDAALLDKVRVGDKVRFAASNDAGKLTVTRLELAK